MNLKRTFIDHVKNIQGFRTNRKIVVFAVDDYGNVRLDSLEARKNMDKEGLKIHSRFDAYDTLETKEDLEVLFETLTSVKDINGNYAIFTPYAVPCNINFEKILETGNQKYVYEELPETYQKLCILHPSNYKGTWSLWQEGIKNKLLVPQFHGREHFNLNVFEKKIKENDKELLIALKNRSYTSISNSGFNTIRVTAAYEFWDFKDNERFVSIIADGLKRFETVYGQKATNFNSPGASEHEVIHNSILKEGIKYVDTPWLKREHQGFGNYKMRINYTGKRNKDGLLFLVRNVVFEPTENKGFDWASYTLKQIETAFKHKKPAIISSHRVNFCGFIKEKNRQRGINELKILLEKIVTKFPDVEFLSAKELGNLIDNKIY